MTDEPKTLQTRLLHKLGSQRKGAGLAFSPDAQTLAVGIDNDVVLYSVKDGKESGKLEGSYSIGYTSCMDYSPDGKTLASGHLFRTLRWDMTGEPISSNLISVGSVPAYSPNGLFLITVEWRSGKLCLWNTQTYEPIDEFGGKIKRVRRILWNVNSKKFLVYGGGGVQVWGIENESTLKSLSIIQEGKSAAWSPKEEDVLAIAKEQVELYRMRDGELVKVEPKTLPLPLSCQEIVWRADTVFLCGGIENKREMAWHLHDGKPMDSLRGVFTITNPSKRGQPFLATTSIEGVSIRKLFVGSLPEQKVTMR